MLSKKEKETIKTLETMIENLNNKINIFSMPRCIADRVHKEICTQSPHDSIEIKVTNTTKDKILLYTEIKGITNYEYLKKKDLF